VEGVGEGDGLIELGFKIVIHEAYLVLKAVLGVY
jgi:hypothetical protein